MPDAIATNMTGFHNMVDHWGQQIKKPLDDIFSPGMHDEKDDRATPESPTYGDISVPMSSEPYLRRKTEGVRTNLTTKKKTTKVQNKAYGVAN